MLTPPYGNRNCTYYREVFPPQWMDTHGQPTLVPSEEVANWVAWQQHSRRDGLQSNGVGSCDVGRQYPGSGGFGVEGKEDIIVGLEVWKEPSDFHVARGLYTGQRVMRYG